MDYNNLRVGYICACYLGHRLHNKGLDDSTENPELSHVVRQVECIKRFSKVISRVTFVCNMDEGNLEQERIFQRIRDLMVECNSSGYIHWEAFSRPNENISYGAWDWALKSRYVNFDYAFVTEDDYVPSLLEFDREVLNRYFSSKQARKEVVKVVELWIGDQSAVPCRVAEKDKAMSFSLAKAVEDDISHSSVPHGVVNIAVYNLLGGFYLPPPSLTIGRITSAASRKDSCMIQQLYLKYYTDAGYKVLSMSEHYSVPYLERPGVIYHFGVDGAPAVFVPCELEDSVI